MGNCQAVEVATAVIQHPCGRVERLYWSLTAKDVMASNPGHYVGIIIVTTTPNAAPVKHLKLLRPHDTLHIGHVYRLVTFQEVLREFGSKKRVRLSRLTGERQMDDVSSERRGSRGGGLRRRVSNPANLATMEVEQQQQQQQEEAENVMEAMGLDNRGSSSGVSKHWRPSLQSIEETAS